MVKLLKKRKKLVINNKKNMALAAHTIKSSKNSKKKPKRLGRGNASGKGTYSGRGLKGQRSRAGGKSGCRLRGLKQSLKKIPKLRGFKSLQPKKEVVTLTVLNKISKEAGIITPFSLKKKGIISNPKRGVKIVATGTIDKPVILKGCLATKKAVELIEKVGGKLVY